MPHAVLIIEDEATLAKNMEAYVAREGYEVRLAESGEQGLEQIAEFKPDVVLTDYRLPGINGLEVLSRIRRIDSQIKLIMITGHGNVAVAVDAMKAGAYDYLSKPVILSELKLLLDRAVGQERLEEALSYYRNKQAQISGLDKLIGESPPMRSLRSTMHQLLNAESGMRDGELPAVLITGETGTGKELVARAIHFEGLRKSRPFVEINCAAIPAQLLEAELFGYERGAFTDARERKIGLAEAADGGTLFLDEIGDVEAGLQGKLLRLLEEKVVRRLGSVRDYRANVRIVAATNRPLEQLVRESKFRSDLYFRLRIIQIALPPLRDRGEDILRLAHHFLALHGTRYGKKQLQFSQQTQEALLAYLWPGNVRELRNVIEQAVLLANQSVIEPAHLTFCATLGVSAPKHELAVPTRASEGLKLEQVERDLLLQALEKTSWNVTHAAKLLGISRDTLRYRIDKYDLHGPRA
jgi:two-component system, NtrC family, response regulator AtoC